METGGLNLNCSQYSNPNIPSSADSNITVGQTASLIHMVSHNNMQVQSHHFHLPNFRMHHFPHFHLHLPHHIGFNLHGHGSKKAMQFYKDVPKGCLAVYVGQGEEQQRFVIPVIYVNHPLFEKLLKEAEEEYGFEQKGTITIPCHVSDFEYVQGLIHREQESHNNGNGSCFRSG